MTNIAVNAALSYVNSKADKSVIAELIRRFMNGELNVAKSNYPQGHEQFWGWNLTSGLYSDMWFAQQFLRADIRARFMQPNDEHVLEA